MAVDCEAMATVVSVSYDAKIELEPRRSVECDDTVKGMSVGVTTPRNLQEEQVADESTPTKAVDETAREAIVEAVEAVETASSVCEDDESKQEDVDCGEAAATGVGVQSLDSRQLTPAATPPTSLPPLAPPVPVRHAISARGDGAHAESEAGRASSTSAMPTSTTGSMAPGSARGIAGGAFASARNWNMQHYIRSNAKVSRLVQAALLKTLIHAIKRGSVEGVRVAIERGVLVRYLDSRQRNLIMLASKCDTDARLPIVVILADAGCDPEHTDQLGWSCLHYACASGALDVATELVRRGVRVEYNPYGYGPEDFLIPKVLRAKSLLQHTEQLHHEKNVKECWTFFRRQAEKSGYAVKARSHCDLGKPLRVSFQAPSGHSALDRIRVVDMNSEDALWMQVSKTFTIPPGDLGSITLDVETLEKPSLYRIFYEKYEPTPMMRVPSDVAENTFSIKNLDTGTTVSVGSVNELVLKELHSTRAGRNAKHASSSSREAPESRTKSVRRMSTTRCRNTASEREPSEASDVDQEDETESMPNDTITVATIEEHPEVHSITGVYRVVAMAIVSVSTLNSAKPNEYEVIVKHHGAIGLSLEPKMDSSKRVTKLIVRRSSGQAASVNPGDCLVAIGNANIEHAGLKHTLWELTEATRPMMLRFRRGTQNEKKSLFTGIRKLAGGKSMAAIAV